MKMKVDGVHRRTTTEQRSGGGGKRVSRGESGRSYEVYSVHRGPIVYLHSLSYISTLALRLHVNIPRWIWRGGPTLMTPYVQVLSPSITR